MTHPGMHDMEKIEMEGQITTKQIAAKFNLKPQALRRVLRSMPEYADGVHTNYRWASDTDPAIARIAKAIEARKKAAEESKAKAQAALKAKAAEAEAAKKAEASVKPDATTTTSKK